VSAAPGVAVLREAVRRAVEATSLRAVAAQIGLTHHSVRNFLNGSSPHASNVRKLREWYVREAASAPEPSAESVEAALSILTETLPEDRRESIGRKMLEMLREEHTASGVRLPRWLR
jgi:hypothetical protein